MPVTTETFVPSPTVKQMLTNTAPKLTDVGVSLIFWGKAWASNPPPTPSAQQFENAIRSIINSNYLGSLAQYGVTGIPSLIAVDIASDSNPPSGSELQPPNASTLTSDQLTAAINQALDNKLQAFVTSRIAAGAVPAPVIANTRFYAVLFAPGFGGAGESAEHQPFSYNGIAAATAWLSNDGTLDSKMSAVCGFSHELAEACSDPQGGGGVRMIAADDKNYEIGDICRWGIDYGNGYSLQSYYSDADKACVIPLTRIINAPHAQTAVVSLTPTNLNVVAVGGDGITYSAAWDQEKRQGKWRGWWSINKGHAQPSSGISLVKRSSNQLDAFITATDGRIYTAAWDATVDVYDGAWRGWWPIVSGQAAPGTPVAAVARSPHQLDAFVVGTDGGVWTAAWDQNVSNGAWRGWWRVLNLVTVPGANITVVSRDPNKLDLFAVGNDGIVYTAAWDQNVSNGAWRGWWPVAGGKAKAGTHVAAVARSPHQLDVFVVSTDGSIWTAAWDQNVSNGAWRGWWRVGSSTSQASGFVTAVTRDPNKLDLFAVAADGEVITAAWDQNVSNGAWRGWWPIATGHATPGSMVSAVSRDPNKLDVFAAGTDGSLLTAAWDQNVSNGAWRGWWSIPN